MTINYTTLLGLAEPVTGTESGTWGDDVNKGITDYLDIAIAGTQTISGSQTAVTLSVTNGSSAANNIAQVGSGATGSSQYQIINCTGNPAGLLTITAPASSKTYIVINATSTSQSVKIVGTGPTTGVTVASGKAALVAWNGSDFRLVATDDITKLTGTLAIANGGTNATATPTAGAVAYGTGTAYAFTSAGTTGQALTSNSTSAPTFGTLGVVGGGTGQTTASAAFNALSPITSTGDLIIGNGTNSATRLAIGTNGYVLTSNGTTATWAASSGGVTTFSAGTTGFTPSSATSGAVTLSGTLGIANGGTNSTATPTAGAVPYGTGTAFAFTSAGTAGQVLTSNGASAPTWAAASGGTAIGLVRAISINCILP